jgi:hypothetical protein
VLLLRLVHGRSEEALDKHCMIPAHQSETRFNSCSVAQPEREGGREREREREGGREGGRESERESERVRARERDRERE